MHDIARRIREMRILRQLTQRQLAELMSPPMQQSRICALEHYPYGQRDVTMNTLERIAVALDCTMDIRFTPNIEPANPKLKHGHPPRPKRSLKPQEPQKPRP